MAVRDHEKWQVLRTVADHDGEWYWYQIDRALSGKHGCGAGPFFEEIEALVQSSLIEIKPNPELGALGRYWLTAAGRGAVERRVR